MSFDAYLILKPKSGAPAFKTEVTDNTFSKYLSMPVYSFSMGYNMPVNLGGAPGKLALSTLNVMVTDSNFVAGFLTMDVAGMAFDRVTLYLRKAGAATGKKSIFTIYSFGNVLVESVQYSGSGGGDDRPVVSLSFAFQQFAHHSTTQSADGTINTSLIGSIDLKLNQSWNDSPIDGPGWV